MPGNLTRRIEKLERKAPQDPDQQYIHMLKVLRALGKAEAGDNEAVAYLCALEVDDSDTENVCAQVVANCHRKGHELAMAIRPASQAQH